MITPEQQRNGQVTAAYILDQSVNKERIYEFMKAHQIGESDYGKLLDSIGREKHLFYHRLEGHSPIFDFPFDDFEHIPDFIEHVWISDSATSNGLPILPNRFLENTFVKSYIQKKAIEWNFLNVFDLLTGTLAIYGGFKNCEKYFSGLESIDGFNQLATQLGIGVTELAIAFSKQNPLLFIGAVFHIIGTVKGVLNSSEMVYFKRINSKYYLIIANPDDQLDKIVSTYYLPSQNPENDLINKVKSYYL